MRTARGPDRIGDRLQLTGCRRIVVVAVDQVGVRGRKPGQGLRAVAAHHVNLKPAPRLGHHTRIGVDDQQLPTTSPAQQVNEQGRGGAALRADLGNAADVGGFEQRHPDLPQLREGVQKQRLQRVVDGRLDRVNVGAAGPARSILPVVAGGDVLVPGGGIRSGPRHPGGDCAATLPVVARGSSMVGGRPTEPRRTRRRPGYPG